MMRMPRMLGWCVCTGTFSNSDMTMQHTGVSLPVLSPEVTHLDGLVVGSLSGGFRLRGRDHQTDLQGLFMFSSPDESPHYRV